jgi:hypothetical protein
VILNHVSGFRAGVASTTFPTTASARGNSGALLP